VQKIKTSLHHAERVLALCPREKTGYRRSIIRLVGRDLDILKNVRKGRPVGKIRRWDYRREGKYQKKLSHRGGGIEKRD